MNPCKYVPYHKEPVVGCDGKEDCEKCGWNPSVHDKRVTEGFTNQKLTAEEAAQVQAELEEKWAEEEAYKRAAKGRVME